MPGIDYKSICEKQQNWINHLQTVLKKETKYRESLEEGTMDQHYTRWLEEKCTLLFLKCEKLKRKLENG